MISRSQVSCRPTSVLGMLACVAAALALSASSAGASEACPNEALRQESNVNSATGRPYSTGLPDCRAYEVVSPPEKQSHDAAPPPVGGEVLGAGGETTENGLPVSPDGEAVGFDSEGAFSEPENYLGGLQSLNYYISHRGASGWSTSSAFAPPTLIPVPVPRGLSSDFSPDLRSLQVNCGSAYLGRPESVSTRVLCARRELGGSWVPTPFFTNLEGTSVFSAAYMGASSDMSHVFISPNLPLLPIDKTEKGAGIYEISGVGTGSATLRLMNIGPPGEETGLTIRAPETQTDRSAQGALLGDRRESPAVQGTDYHAISENGERVFFTAHAGAVTTEGIDILTVFARVACVTGPHCRYVKKVEQGLVTEEGETGIAGTGRETVEVSAQSSECTGPCKSSPAANATFQGASADGSKVFFTTEQELLNADENTVTDLYEYEFTPSGGKLKLISGGKEGEQMGGVVRTSLDGSHVYFVASECPPQKPNVCAGVLTTEANKNGEKAEAGENLYGYDTVHDKIKFVAQSPIDFLSRQNSLLNAEQSTDTARHAQTTPDGRYLVFSSSAHLEKTGELNNHNCLARSETKSPCSASEEKEEEEAQVVYRYDFETGELTWISHGAPGFKVENEGPAKYKGELKAALVAPLPRSQDGAEVDIGDWNRAISDKGEYIIFSTKEKLQADDENNAVDLYEWHNGTVSMISDGHNRNQNERPAWELSPGGMSASGSDIFFFTHSALVGQDSGVLVDLYDARVDGGFPAPVAEASCSGEECQGAPSPAPPLPSASSSVFAGGGNLTAPPVSPAPPTAPKPKPKPLTRAQKLAKALRACRGKPNKKRRACEAQARKRYGTKAKAKKAATAKQSARGTR